MPRKDTNANKRYKSTSQKTYMPTIRELTKQKETSSREERYLLCFILLS